MQAVQRDASIVFTYTALHFAWTIFPPRNRLTKTIFVRGCALLSENLVEFEI